MIVRAIRISTDANIAQCIFLVHWQYFLLIGEAIAETSESDRNCQNNSPWKHSTTYRLDLNFASANKAMTPYKYSVVIL